jgi:nitrile hydratase accessory protein
VSAAEAADDVVFAAPWEAQAFALAVALQRRGVFDATEWAGALGAAIAAAPDAPYYESWLAALESLLEAKAVADRSTLDRYRDAWAHAADRTPHGAPIELAPADFGP